MNRVTVLSFGYWGWGTNTKQLVKLASEWEEQHGFAPPMWVDVRLQRQARAPEFRGDRFAEATGAANYVWMGGLGNAEVADPQGNGIRIAKPKQAEALLDIVLEKDEQGQKVVFFCACPLICEGGKPRCHRHEVGRLLLEAARRRGVELTVAEWPGGEPEVHEIPLDDRVIERWEAKQFPRKLVPRRVPLLAAQGTVFRFRGKEMELLTCLRTPILRGTNWSYRTTDFEWKRGRFSEKDIVRFKKTMAKEYGFTPRSV